MRHVKGQGLSLNAIVIAALVLIVLVVLVMIFTGRLGVFNQGIDKDACETVGGHWETRITVTDGVANCPDGMEKMMIPSTTVGQICCRLQS
jgi:hypothetical protein